MPKLETLSLVGRPNVFGDSTHFSCNFRNLPNFKKDNSFEYGPNSVDGPITLKQGPKLNPYYTPWIVGGGYTDGMYNYNNFMGGDRGGVISGLHGHLGSVKFYSKPLSTQEVSQNYNAQKGYFKNIK